MTIKEQVEDVISVVCESYGIKSAQLTSNAGKPYPEARRMIYYIVKIVLDIQINNKDLDIIVRNKRDNATVSGGIKQFAYDIKSNNRLRLRLQNVMHIYYNGQSSLSKKVGNLLKFIIQMNDINLIKNELGVIITKLDTDNL